MKPLNSLAEFENRMRVARQNVDGWKACQDMAWAARYAPEGKVLPAVREAFELAEELPDEYQRLAVQAWPLRALIERGHANRIETLLPGLIELSGLIPIPVCRCDALLLVWEAVALLPFKSTEPLLNKFTWECRNSGSWKGAYILRDVALQVAPLSAIKAAAIVDAMPAGKYQRQALARLAANIHSSPRPFFW